MWWLCVFPLLPLGFGARRVVLVWFVFCMFLNCFLRRRSRGVVSLWLSSFSGLEGASGFWIRGLGFGHSGFFAFTGLGSTIL